MLLHICIYVRKTNYQINLYIGSDNVTHKIEKHNIKKVNDILNYNYEGCTLIKVNGFYKNNSEECLKIELIQEGNLIKIKNKIVDVINQLKKELMQEAILMTITKSQIYFI